MGPIKGALALLCFFPLLAPALFAQALDGHYEPIPPAVAPKAHSLKQVTVHEVFFFGCPHCYELHKQLPALQAEFGNRLKLVSVPIGWGGHDPGRLLLIARRKGPEKEHEVKEMIFNFVHDKGLGKSMFTRDKLQFVAKLTGLSAEFETQMDDPKIVAQMNDGVAYAQAKGVESTPTLVIQDSIKVVGADVANLRKVINSLLVEPVN
ncbi:MAG: DsbA family protein [bacterium]|nr:DsbA family protein [bacterium]